jgi:outer membrane lipoprotein-sorting protein
MLVKEMFFNDKILIYNNLFFFDNHYSHANNKENIINNLYNTKNVNFDFEQNINEKIEKGNCVIEYPKKIFCEYSGSNNKILVSNGNSLVIKTNVSYYLYPLNKTPLNLILDKDYLINKIYNLEERVIDESFINYKINENGNEISIFFDNQSYNLIGWQTKDVYQNLNITFLSSVKKNEPINKNIFKLPSQN